MNAPHRPGMRPLSLKEDPFGLGRFPVPDHEAEDGEAFRHLADLEAPGEKQADTPPDPSVPTRHIYQDKDGRLALVEVNPFEVVHLGVRVKFSEAEGLATAVLSGDSTAISAPLVAHTLALAYMGALIAAERRRAEHEPAEARDLEAVA